MEPFRLHVFVCDQRGSGEVLEALRREIENQWLEDEVLITTCGSLGLCEHGPILIVYPEGIWYSEVRPQDMGEIVRSHFQDGIPVARLVRTDMAGTHAEILRNREKKCEAGRDGHASREG